MPPPSFALVGQLLCLDLVNTEVVRADGPADLLPDLDTLWVWLEAAGVLTEAAGRRARERWGSATNGRRLFAETVALRRALRTLAATLANGRPAPPASVTAINRVLAFRPAVLRVERSGDGFVTRRAAVADSPLHLLVPVAESAAWLLEHGDCALVRQCESATCVRYFYESDQEQAATLVQHGGMRQPRQGGRLLPANRGRRRACHCGRSREQSASWPDRYS